MNEKILSKITDLYLDFIEIENSNDDDFIMGLLIAFNTNGIECLPTLKNSKLCLTFKSERLYINEGIKIQSLTKDYIIKRIIVPEKCKVDLNILKKIIMKISAEINSIINNDNDFLYI